MKVSSSTHKCMTCDYWCGQREVVQFGGYVEADASEHGSCQSGDSSSRLLENKQAQWSCSNWDKWGALK